jgi:hypothetical protein
MKYLCLVYHDVGTDVDALPASEFNAIMVEVSEYLEDLQAGGHYIAASPLQPVQTATTLRVRNGQVTVTDGPFAETKEHLAGFYLIEARDLNDAIRLASKTPSARLGSIEVRPLKELSLK